MTKEEAVDTLKLMQSQVEWDYPMDYSAAIDMAVAALAEEPEQRSFSYSQENDMISRQAAIEALTENKEMINAVLDSLTLDYNTRRYMDDIISRQAAIKLADFMNSGRIGSNPKYCWKKAKDILAKMPSAEEITCKYCNHYIHHDKRCDYWNHGVEPSEWCCHAVMKGEFYG